MTKTAEKRQNFIDYVRQEYGNKKNRITRKEVKALTEKYGLDWPSWLVTTKELKVTGSRGEYYLPINVNDLTMGGRQNHSVEIGDIVVKEIEEIVDASGHELVPDTLPNYVKHGNYKDVEDIIRSKIFYPSFITGLSGNGKTLMVEQACANEKREMVRVNVTIETDEDDLLGGFRLKNGETVWEDGPAIVAMERGAILLLDEVDLASNKIMCLQPILEGKAIYLKKINRVVHPKTGFNVFATANTKGQGSSDGKFIGTNVLNEAFLERFAITFEQEYPNKNTEASILMKQYKANTGGVTPNAAVKDFIGRLVNWSDTIRKLYFVDGSETEVISTRRLVHIISAFNIFKDENKSVEVCLARFNDETKDSFFNLWRKLKPNVDELSLDDDDNDDDEFGLKSISADLNKFT